MHFSFEIQFGSRIVQADQSIDLPPPAGLHDATTDKMLASSTMMQLAFLAI
jgi:hypothetical protein